MSQRPRRDPLKMARAASGGTSLAAFTEEPSVPNPAEDTQSEVSPLPAASPVVTPDDDNDYGDFEDPADDAPAPTPRRSTGKRKDTIRTKTFPMLQTTVDAVSESSLAWHIADPTRMQHFGGTASETAFVQALLLFAVDRISKNQKDADRLLRYFPENARVRNR
ncbi:MULTISPECIES: hypothetical protein [Rhodococcus]|jgi:hypothetical protein|uniref:Uncharacterized protein n=1 Tax=Rhodococcus baikonurensis TaxID=172041 RepID=A0ABV5XMY6_9NOCA|nr:MULTISPECIES: hypothetical protein [Rhodococcus]AZI65600.1 hypothetical protein EHW12_31260 [Rhodococcus sp. NJ-530]MDJ0440279.1 hypothetical protein [Rhodococcus qingshengii]SCC70572.1 hypothetical protein GA0061093_1554 [Rhodococcus qingshengii]